MADARVSQNSPDYVFFSDKLAVYAMFKSINNQILDRIYMAVTTFILTVNHFNTVSFSNSGQQPFCGLSDDE